MSLSSRMRSLLRDDRGATAALVALFMTSTLGLTAAAVDLGVLYTARSELQSAADAAALAAANTMISRDANNNAHAATSTSLSTARTISGANKAIGINVPLKNPAGNDFTIGYWDTQTGDFDPNRTGMGINNTDDLTGVRVKIRRDASANTPVSTYFAGIVGLQAANVDAASTAFLGYPASVPSGTVDLPIAVVASAITDSGQPNCGDSLTFHSSGDQNAEWTTFFTWPANDNTVDHYVCGCLPVPALKLGDQINMTNGNLSNNTFRDLQDRFEANAVNGHWTVTLPVIAQPGMGANQGTVVGFMNFDITQVRTAPFKDLTGTLKCQMVVPNSSTGGDNFGSRASASKLVR